MSAFTQQDRARLCALSLEISDAKVNLQGTYTERLIGWAELERIAKELHEIAHSSDGAE
jgi:hypothetical protein